MNSGRFQKLLLVGLLLASACQAIGVKNLRIEDLVRASDVIAIADVVEVRTVGPGQPITFKEQRLRTDAYVADLVVRDRIKGAVAGRIQVNYELPTSFIGYQGLRHGTRLVFLRKEGTSYHLADPYYPDFPAINTPLENSGASVSDYAARVLHEMLAVVASPSATPAEKSEILRVDYALPSNKDAIAALKSASAAALQPELQQRLQGELIKLGDISELANIVHTLANNLATEDQRVWLLYVIGNHLTNSRAIPILQPLLASNDSSMREAAAEALWHIADSAAVPSLVKALGDSDPQVRFYAVRACAEIANEPDWGGPSESEFLEHQQEYLAHCQAWATNQKQK